jgi:hypothetical protein
MIGVKETQKSEPFLRFSQPVSNDAVHRHGASTSVLVNCKLFNNSNLTVRMTFGNLEGEAKVLLHVMIFTRVEQI